MSNDNDAIEVSAEEVSPETMNGGGQIDTQVATAKKFPRSVDKCLKQAKTLAARDSDTAEQCFYVFPQGGSKIDGPSIRLAEIFLTSWQNLRAESRVVEVLEKEVVAEGMAWDMENNSAARKEVSQSIIGSDGSRYPDNMIKTTANAACSIALRNAVFTVIPRPYVDEVYEEVRKASMDDGKTVKEKRKNLLSTFEDMGVHEQQVFDVLGVSGPEDIGESDIVDMRGLYNAIDDNQVSISDVFGDKSQRENAEINRFIHDDEEEDDSEEGGD